MPKYLCALFAILLCGLAPANAQQPAASPPPAQNALTPEQARRALETLQDDAKRNQMIDTLRAIAGTTPAATSAQPAPAAEAPPLAADSLGAQLLLSASDLMAETSRQIGWAARSVMHLPALWGWIVRTTTDPAYYDVLIDIAWKLALVFGGALAVEWLLGRLLRRPLALLEARIPREARAPASSVAISDPPSSRADLESAPELRRRRLTLTRIWQSLIRLPFVFGRLVLELLPVAAFVAVAIALLGTAIGDAGTPRLVILAIVNAYVICRLVTCVVHVGVSPPGLLKVRDETAAYIEIWIRRIAALGVGGFAVANVALLLGLHRGGYLAILRLAMLAVHLLVVVIILQCRRPVAQMIRAPEGSSGFIARGRNRLAQLWHVPAAILVIALWAVWALNIRDGYTLLLQYFVGTLVVLLVARLVSVVVLSLIDRGFRINPQMLQRFPGLEARANRYLPMLRKIVSGVIAVIAGVALLQVWGADTIVWFYGGQIGRRVLSAVLTVGIAVAAAVAVWEICNAVMDRKLSAMTRDGHLARAARLRTFQPMLRTTLLGVILAVVGLTALSEIGINVAPLLAGAGIVGVAVGFGSQKLVQDVITGLFLLLENVVQVGDNVTVSGLSGTVENLSIRTIRLRAGDGSVHVVPFSAVTSITNASRGAGNAAVNVSIAYKEDTDRVGRLLKDIVTDMRGEADYRGLIRGDLELWGVDKIDGAAASLVGQIRCTDSGRWAVQREFNRRVKRAFQEQGVEIAVPGQIVVVQQAPADREDSDRSRRATARAG